MALDAGTRSPRHRNGDRGPGAKARKLIYAANGSAAQATYVCKYNNQLVQQCISWATIDVMSQHWMFAGAIKERRLNRRSLEHLARGIVNLRELLQSKQRKWERRRPEFCVQYVPDQYWEVRSRGPCRFRRNVLQVLFGAHRAAGTCDQYQDEDHQLVHMVSHKQQQWDSTLYTVPPCSSWPVCINPAHWDERDAWRKQRQRMLLATMEQRAKWALEMEKTMDCQIAQQRLMQDRLRWYGLPFIRIKVCGDGDGFEEAVRWNEAEAAEILTDFPPQPEGLVLISQGTLEWTELQYRQKLRNRFPQSEARRARYWRRIARMVDQMHSFVHQQEVEILEQAEAYELLTPCYGLSARQAAAQNGQLAQTMNSASYVNFLRNINDYASCHPDEYTNEQFIFTQQLRIQGAVRHRYEMEDFYVDDDPDDGPMTKISHQPLGGSDPIGQLLQLQLLSNQEDEDEDDEDDESLYY